MTKDFCDRYPIRHINSKECYVCGKPVKKCGLCSAHLHRLYRYGDPAAPLRKANDGRTSHPLYQTYKGMRSRCYVKSQQEYEHYGGRGIKVCERWLNKETGFWNFVKDVGDKPGPEYTLDRIDINGDYCPENCQWATPFGQANNTQRANRIIAEAMESGFELVLKAKVIVKDDYHNFAFETLDELIEFVNKLKKGKTNE